MPNEGNLLLLSDYEMTANNKKLNSLLNFFHGNIFLLMLQVKRPFCVFLLSFWYNSSGILILNGWLLTLIIIIIIIRVHYCEAKWDDEEDGGKAEYDATQSSQTFT